MHNIILWTNFNLYKFLIKRILYFYAVIYSYYYFIKLDMVNFMN